MKVFLLLASIAFAASSSSGAEPVTASSSWNFAVSGDSRNCGDVVMPSIAASVRQNSAAFYWHLGDLRWISNFDDDMAGAAALANRPLDILSYHRAAWPAFIRNQIAPFAPTPFILSIGNHETVAPKTRQDFLIQFADWIDQPRLQQQRLLDDPEDHQLHAYFHWYDRGIDFISLDNATPEMFDNAEILWLEKIFARDSADTSVRAIVLGMHASLPHSLACDHSMNDTAQGTASGTRVYKDLLRFRDTNHQQVYVLASHSHFVMSDIFDTPYWRANGGVLPGWIVGTAGALRYPLPATATQSPYARTGVYGYLLGTVNPPGSAETITFAFQEVQRKDVGADVVTRYGAETVTQCFENNIERSAAKIVTCAEVEPCEESNP